MRMFAITGRTESGDEFVYVVENSTRPTEDEVDAIICRDWDLEYEEIGFTNWDIEELMFSPMPTTSEIDEMNELKARVV